MNLIGTMIRRKVASRTRMLLALALVLATLAAAAAPASPALAQEGGVVGEEKATQEEEGAAKEGVTQEEGVPEKEATQEERARVAGPATATGVLGRAAPHSPDPAPVYAITDDPTGTPYELVSGFVDLEQYVGERVTIQGVPVPGPGDPNKPPLLNVTQIQPSDGGNNGDPAPVNDEATLSFELTVEGEPPADAAFFGNVHTGEGGPGRYVPLADPEDDGVYTGSTTVDRFGPGPRPVPPGVEPVSFPVKIVQGTDGEAYRSIKDFGTVKLDGDKTFSAGVSFDDEEPDPEEVSATGRIGQIADFPGASHAITDEASGNRYFLTSDSVDLQDYAVSGERVVVYGTPVPNRYTTDTTLNVTRVEPAGTTPPPNGDGGSENNGGSDNDSGSDDSGPGGSGSGGSGSGGSSGGSSGSIASGIRGVLPSTGGSMALTLLVAGVLMTGGGLLVRRLAR
jgi:LPXTG-motif cell wall-anchored protein